VTPLFQNKKDGRSLKTWHFMETAVAQSLDPSSITDEQLFKTRCLLENLFMGDEIRNSDCFDSFK